MKPVTHASSPRSVANMEAFLPCLAEECRTRVNCPELRLVAAMFGNAVQSVVRNATAECGPRRQEFLDACAWFWDDSRSWPFAFTNACDLLGLDVSAVRRCLRVIIEAEQQGARSPLERAG